MTRLAKLALLGLLGFAFLADAGGQVPWDPVSAPWNKRQTDFGPDPVQGRFVAIGGQFGELSYACVSCHQLDGTADRSGAIPRIAGQSQWYLFEALRQFASGARPSHIMEPIAAELTLRDMHNVAAFYAGIANQPFPPTLVRAKHDVLQQGREIAFAGLPKEGVPACITCHGAYGAGNAPLFPYLLGQFEPYLERQLHKFKAGKRPSNIMTQIASKLSEDQIKAVSAYFASLKPEDVPAISSVTPGQDAAQAGKPPARAAKKPHLGATIDPKQGRGDVVVPGATPFH